LSFWIVFTEPPSNSDRVRRAAFLAQITPHLEKKSLRRELNLLPRINVEIGIAQAKAVADQSGEIAA